jgi:Uma2 family endonuclease
MSVNLVEQSFDEIGVDPILVALEPVLSLSDDQFFEFCQLNRDLRIERTAEGELIIMPPVGFDSGDREAEITTQLRNWAKREGTGTAFGPSTGFRLPNRANRSPDASWVRHSRSKDLTAEQRNKFAPICPDFVVELRSETDRLKKLRDKMEEYIENGAELGLLIDPIQRKVHIYRRDKSPEILDNPQSVDCGPTLPGFVLDLLDVWPREPLP